MINKIKNWYKEYKNENLIFRQFEEPTPKIEKIAGWFVVLMFIILGFLEYYLVDIQHKSGILAILSGILTFLYHLQFKRDVSVLKKYYRLKKNNSLQKRTVFTSAFVIKTIKSTAIFCIKCGGIGVTTNWVYGEIFGFSPLNEVGRCLAGVQTWEQGFYHSTHPMQYINSPDSPIVQDLKVENVKLKKMVEDVVNNKK